MSRKREFGEGVLYSAANYIFWFLLGNLYFALVNIPFIFVWLGTTQETFTLNIITVIALVPVGPALAALLSVMGKLVREKDVNLTKDFFKAYKRNFLEAMFYWVFLLIVLTILYIDIVYFNIGAQFKFVKVILLVTAFMVASMIFYIFPIISRFYLRIRDVIRISFSYCIRKFHITILNWTCFVGLAYAASKFANAIFFFMWWSILCYLIMFNTKGIMEEIEEKYVAKAEKNQN